MRKKWGLQMVVRYLSAQRHTGTVSEIAKLKFPFPNDQFPDFETTVNEPVQQVSVGKHNGKDLFPDIVVMRRPGSWLKMMAEVEMVDTITDEQAQEVWLQPFAWLEPDRRCWCWSSIMFRGDGVIAFIYTVSVLVPEFIT